MGVCMYGGTYEHTTGVILYEFFFSVDAPIPVSLYFICICACLYVKYIPDAIAYHLLDEFLYVCKCECMDAQATYFFTDPIVT